jgi:hypothetical protein
MNIFFVDKDPVVAAQMLCDKHVSKMTLETAQMLCTALRTKNIRAPYQAAYENHPCNIWVRWSQQNFNWLVAHGCALGDTFYTVFGHHHKSTTVIKECGYIGVGAFPDKFLSKPPLCMPDKYKSDKVVQSYRDYYNGEKLGFAVWKNRLKPEWVNLKKVS